ncbi:glycosyltransferase family 4 protein [Flavobacterium difficile]|uniref:Glycosyltransferase family 4 protein n=1 Tax=Flavobacterium difficile TaxID=2709659 RepID=A0ABX0I2Y5_9FLAO|nr:glycosyltransferase family 4 protein [Flavobacterium difficile]NHM01144.1 glycosyltransferase family 4 protein [Flavobacterium difficile]
MKILYLGNKLSQHGVNLTTIETLGTNLTQAGFHVVSYSSIKNSFIRMLHMFYGILKHKNASYILIDTYSTSAFWFAFFCSQLARVLKISYIPILHGGNLPQRLLSHPKFCKLIFKNAYKNVSPSTYLKHHFDAFGVTNVICIPNSVNLMDYHYLERSNFSPKLLWVRAFSTIYNPKMAIDVLNLLQKKFPEATLTMVGPDKDGSLLETKNYAATLNLTVNFTGKLSKSEWTALAQAHDFFINTTHFDNTPVSVIEAMALGLPVFSTNVGGIPFLISHQKNGFLVPDSDANEMAKQIENSILFPVKTMEVVHNAKTFVGLFDWKVVKNEWMDILR